MLTSTNVEFNMQVVDQTNDNERILKIFKRLILGVVGDNQGKQRRSYKNSKSSGR